MSKALLVKFLYELPHHSAPQPTNETPPNLVSSKSVFKISSFLAFNSSMSQLTHTNFPFKNLASSLTNQTQNCPGGQLDNHDQSSVIHTKFTPNLSPNSTWYTMKIGRVIYSP